VFIHPVFLFGRSEGDEQDVRLGGADFGGDAIQLGSIALEAERRTVGLNLEIGMAPAQRGGSQMGGTRPASQEKDLQIAGCGPCTERLEEVYSGHPFRETPAEQAGSQEHGYTVGNYEIRPPVNIAQTGILAQQHYMLGIGSQYAGGWAAPLGMFDDGGLRLFKREIVNQCMADTDALFSCNTQGACEGV
jgi:hypothetical protein